MSAKRTVVEQKFKKMEAEAKRLGVILLTKPETFIDDDHLDCTWYGGYIGRPDCAKFRDFKAILQDCADNKCDMIWS